MENCQTKVARVNGALGTESIVPSISTQPNLNRCNHESAMHLGKSLKRYPYRIVKTFYL